MAEEWLLDDWDSDLDAEPGELVPGQSMTIVDAMAHSQSFLSNSGASVMSVSALSMTTYDDIGLSFDKTTIASWISQVSVARKVKMTVLHNSGTPASSDQGLATVKSFSDYHVHHNGWKAIGYHWIISTNGTIYAGRKMAYTGAHAGAAGNPESIGVCLVGNFETNDKPTQAQKEAFVALHNALHAKYYGNNPKLVRFHREFVSTECPGKISQDEVMSWFSSVPVGDPLHPKVVLDGVNIGKGKVIDNQTYVYIRDFEKAGYEVKWDGHPNYVVTITKK